MYAVALAVAASNFVKLFQHKSKSFLWTHFNYSKYITLSHMTLIKEEGIFALNFCYVVLLLLTSGMINLIHIPRTLCDLWDWFGNRRFVMNMSKYGCPRMCQTQEIKSGKLLAANHKHFYRNKFKQQVFV